MVKARYIICILLLGGALSVTSCSRNAESLSYNQSSENTNKTQTDETTSYDQSVELIDFSLYQFDGIGEYNEDIIKTANDARAISSVIIQNILAEDIRQYNICKVSYDRNSEIWVVHYLVDEFTLGGDCNIAMSKKTGEVLKIWYGE